MSVNYYGYSGKKTKHKSNKRKVVINVLIILFTIAASVAFALILGNHLKNKIDNSTVSDVPVGELIPQTTEGTEKDEGPYQKPGYTYESLAAVRGFLDLEGCPDGESAARFVNGLKSCGYTGVLFVLCDDEGRITCSFDAVSDLTGVVPVGSVTSKAILSSAFAEAKKLGMRVSVYAKLSDLYSPDDAQLVKRIIDKRILSELCSMGADEFILDGAITMDNFDSQHAGLLYEYVSELRDICPGAAIGITIDGGIFENPELTPTLEHIYMYCDFFCVDFTNTEIFTDEALSDFLDRYSGSFTAYNICSLLPGSTLRTIQDGYEKFTSDGRMNLSFAKQKTDYEPVYDEESGELDYVSSKTPNYSLLKDSEPDDNGDGTED